MQNKINSAIGKLISEKLDGLLVTNPINIFYLTGFKGISPTEREAILVVKKTKSVLITARLYSREAQKLKSPNLDVKIASERDEYEGFTKDALKGLKNLGFESNNLTYAEHNKFKKYTNGKFTPIKKLIEDLRQIKSPEEIENIKKAQLITQKAFKQILKTIKVGQTEVEIAEKLRLIITSLGAQGLAFDSIIASGPNSALPHYATGYRKIKKGDTLLFDFGAKFNNYCADFSRTVFIGRANSVQQNTYSHVANAQQLAIKKIKAGQNAKDIFNISHNYFKKLGLDNNFIHSLGHGIGCQVHEKPSLSKKSKDKLENGMVFSVEPGLYFNWGGVRIEDLVYIENGKVKLIGQAAEFTEIVQ